MATVEGQIWLAEEPANRLLLDQIGLLQAIADCGSISAAARATGISYKTAWDRLERLNNLSSQALVFRSTGGSKGGGTLLTEYGEKILQGFGELNKLHKEFLQSLNNQLESLDDISGFMKHSSVQASARNQFSGSIKCVDSGAVNTEIQIRLSESLELVAIVTQRSREELNLQVEDTILALVKASSVTLAVADQADNPPRVSARNQFSGVISRIERGSVNSDISIDIGDNKTLAAIITNHSVDQMGLEESMKVFAFFKASSVILMTV